MPAEERETVQTQLAVISTKLDLLIEQRSDHEVRIRTLEEASMSPAARQVLEGRIRSLEQFKWLLAGACLAGGGAAGTIATKLIGG